MEQHTRWYLGAIVSAILAILTAMTVIGGIVFGLMSLGCLVKGIEAKRGERPWWAKSVFSR